MFNVWNIQVRCFSVGIYVTTTKFRSTEAGSPAGDHKTNQQNND